jgi:hypothetical protein
LSGSRFFRGLSRVNSVLLFLTLATLIVILVVVLVQETTRAKKADVPVSSVVANDDENTALHFERGEVDQRSGVVRMSLVTRTESKGIGSSGTTRSVRNLLFVPADGTPAHWLLPDNNHEVTDPTDITEPPPREDSKTVASVVVVRPVDTSDEIPGTALLFDPTGRRVTEIAKAMTTIDMAELTNSEIVIIYRNGDSFYRSTFDPSTLAKRNENSVQVPKLKESVLRK